MGQRVKILSLLLWLMGALAIFYAVQKPLPAHQMLAVIRVGLDLAAALLIFILGAALGQRLLGRFPFESEGERWLFGIGVGLGALSIGTLAMGLAGWFTPGALSALVALLTLVNLRPILSALRAAATIPRCLRPPPALGIYLAISLSLSLLLALAPPSIAFDALLYHLVGPQLYLEAGRIYAVDNVQLYFPSLVETLFALALALRSDAAAQLLHYGYGLLAAGALYLLASRFLPSRARWWALALLWSMPMFALLLGWAYSDLALLFYQLLCVYAFLRWMENGSRPWLFLSAACAGLTMGVKYTAFVLPLALLGLWAWNRVRRGYLRAEWREGLVFSSLALAAASPWLLRNWWLVGNPVYPFLWGGRFWDSWLSRWYEQPGSGLGLEVASLLRLPLTISLGLDVWGTARDQTFFDGRPGPLLLALLPLLFISRRSSAGADLEGPRRASNMFLFIFLAQFAFWTLGVMRTQSLFQARLLLPGLAFLILALAQSLEEVPALSTKAFSLPRFLSAVVGLALGLGLMTQVGEFAQLNPIPYLLGQEGRGQYLHRVLGPHYAAMEYINSLPESSTVQFLWEPRTYYSQRQARPDPILSALKHEVALRGSAAEIARAWREEGITHVLFWRAGFDFLQDSRDRRFALSQEETAIWNELRAGYLVPLYRDPQEAYILYALSSGSS